MKDLRQWIAACEKEKDLKRITAEVDWDLEVGHVATWSERKGGPALLFENVKGYKMPVLFSSVATQKRLAISCSLPPSYSLCDVAQEWMKVVTEGKTIKPVEVKGKVPVMEEVIEGKDVNLFDFPSPRLYPRDGGRYLGLAFMWITQDPDTGWTNVGTYRGQLFDEKSIGANFSARSKHGGMHAEKTRKKGQHRMPAAVYCGCDMAHFIVASAMVPDQVDEWDVIGGLGREPVEVFTSDLTGLRLPANAEIILEGEVELDPAQYKEEGPLGEYIGFYGASGWTERKPFFDVKRILRRKNPIFVASTVGRPIGDTHIATAVDRTANLWADLVTMKVPGVQSVYCPPEATGRFWAIVSVKCTYPAQGRRVAEAVCASPTGHYGLKGIIVVDGDIRADDMAGVWWSMAVRYNPVDDTQIMNKMRATPFDPSQSGGAKPIGSRIILDCTTPVEWEKKPIPVDLDDTTMEKVKARWNEYGIGLPF